jgi:acylphosphatase
LIDGLTSSTIQVTGVVQGVNFRNWTKKQANSYGISGFIRNADEGHVEGEAFGSAQAMDNLCAIRCRGNTKHGLTGIW